MNKSLCRGEKMQLTCHHRVHLEGSPRGGDDPVSVMEVKEDTVVIVAEDCEPDIYSIPVHCLEESLIRRCQGQPFFVKRRDLKRAVTEYSPYVYLSY